MTPKAPTAPQVRLWTRGGEAFGLWQHLRRVRCPKGPAINTLRATACARRAAEGQRAHGTSAAGPDAAQTCTPFFQIRGANRCIRPF